MKRIFLIAIASIVALVTIGGIAMAYIGVRNDDMTLPVCVNTTNGTVRPLVPDTSCANGEQVNLITPESLPQLFSNSRVPVRPTIKEKTVLIQPSSVSGNVWEHVVINCADYGLTYAIGGGFRVRNPDYDVKITSSEYLPINAGGYVGPGGWQVDIRNTDTRDTYLDISVACYS